jgi:radical SAM superfamily enzyme YgiQ (UPF0313 family)
MIKKGIRGWTCQVRCDVTKDKETLELMSKAGCAVVCVGFESVNDLTLRAYRKRQTVEDIIDSIRIFHGKKIKIHGMFVLGGDDDNERAVWDTLKFSITQEIDTIQLMILTPAPGTKLYTDLKEQERIFSYDWDLYDGQHVVFNPKLLSARQLQVSVNRAYARFYSLRRVLLLLTKMDFRNALFCFMGYRIYRQWLRQNSTMDWLQENKPDPKAMF